MTFSSHLFLCIPLLFAPPTALKDGLCQAGCSQDVPIHPISSSCRSKYVATPAILCRHACPTLSARLSNSLTPLVKLCRQVCRIVSKRLYNCVTTPFLMHHYICPTVSTHLSNIGQLCHQVYQTVSSCLFISVITYVHLYRIMWPNV